MTLTDREIGDVTIIDIDGRITVEEGADTFREGVQQIIRQDRVRLVLNFRGVPYIDSTAMGEIIRAYTSATRRGGTLKLLNVPARIHAQLRTTRLLSVFDLFEAEPEAVGASATNHEADLIARPPHREASRGGASAVFRSTGHRDTETPRCFLEKPRS